VCVGDGCGAVGASWPWWLCGGVCGVLESSFLLAASGARAACERLGAVGAAGVLIASWLAMVLMLVWGVWGSLPTPAWCLSLLCPSRASARPRWLLLCC